MKYKRAGSSAVRQMQYENIGWEHTINDYSTSE